MVKVAGDGGVVFGDQNEDVLKVEVTVLMLKMMMGGWLCDKRVAGFPSEKMIGDGGDQRR
ncbi:hypothetical protein HanIR_Chr15g0775341 [Helianthus annuus]|nr:hypothetical protein HanIR_Chr15g0775341 [Helianthus annuus]